MAGAIHDGDGRLRVSVVVPALNEAGSLPATLDALADHAQGAEVVVVDAGSCDGTAAVVAAHGSGPRLVSPGGRLTRGAALNAGAAAARGEVLWFLHADTWPQPGQLDALLAVLEDPAVVGGAFEFGFRERGLRLAIVESINRARYRMRKRFYGDQGIFVRRRVFEQLGGFPEYGLMEDAHFCRDIQRLGRLQLIRSVLPTSARRFLARGVLTVLWFDVRVWFTDLVGGDAQAFADAYRESNLARKGDVR